MMPYSNSHIRRHELLRFSTLINNNLFTFTYFYVQFKNLFYKNVNINHKMFSLLIYARHEGTDHCRKKYHNPLTRNKYFFLQCSLLSYPHESYFRKHFMFIKIADIIDPYHIAMQNIHFNSKLLVYRSCIFINVLGLSINIFSNDEM